MLASSLSSHSAKIFASVALVAGAASVAGLGTFGAFTSTTSASEDVSTGRVVMNLAQHPTLGTSVAATGMVPGDTVQRAVTLTRGSETETFGSVKLTTAAQTANLLASDANHGLQLTVDQCSTAWTKGAGNELSCSGTTTNVVASRAVVGSADLGAVTTALNSSAGASNLRVTLALPAAAGNDFQGLNNKITFTFDATQRAAQAK